MFHIMCLQASGNKLHWLFVLNRYDLNEMELRNSSKRLFNGKLFQLKSRANISTQSTRQFPKLIKVYKRTKFAIDWKCYVLVVPFGKFAKTSPAVSSFYRVCSISYRHKNTFRSTSVICFRWSFSCFVMCRDWGVDRHKHIKERSSCMMILPLRLSESSLTSIYNFRFIFCFYSRSSSIPLLAQKIEMFISRCPVFHRISLTEASNRTAKRNPTIDRNDSSKENSQIIPTSHASISSKKNLRSFCFSRYYSEKSKTNWNPKTQLQSF